jgi:uncharacterized membrane protein YbhN (UPF0104 family)
MDKAVTKQMEKCQEFLVAEFNYIAQTAFQAHEDRARVSEFFLVIFGTFLAAILSSQIDGIQNKLLYAVFAILFFVIAFLGILTLIELTRLRLAWMDSARAMNAMKEKVIECNADLADFFNWRMNTMPKAYKPKSVGFLKALQVAVLSGLAKGAVIVFVALYFGCTKTQCLLIVGIISLLIAVISAFILMFICYRLPLQKKNKNQTTPNPASS